MVVVFKKLFVSNVHQIQISVLMQMQKSKFFFFEALEPVQKPFLCRNHNFSGNL